MACSTAETPRLMAWLRFMRRAQAGCAEDSVWFEALAP
jgi:hypothetical protein